MNILDICPTCRGSGRLIAELPEPSDIDCPNCADGYIRQAVEAPELTEIMGKCEEIKTKQNQMQADINYIKAKVG